MTKPQQQRPRRKEDPASVTPEISDEAYRQAVEEAEADFKAGRWVSLEEIEAWIETVGTPDERPIPRPWER